MRRTVRIPTGYWWALTLIIACSGAAYLALGYSPQEVQAKSSYKRSLVNQYPSLAGTKLDSCQTCHVAVPDLNPYGGMYKDRGHSFQAIELLDSDEDGWSNLDEILAGTWPGDKNDFPSQSPTATATATATASVSNPAPSATPTAATQSHLFVPILRK